MLSPSALILIAFSAWIARSLVDLILEKRFKISLEPGGVKDVSQRPYLRIGFVRIDLYELRDWCESIMIAAILAFIVVTYVARTFIIPSSSMVPTLQIGDVILVDKLGVRFTGIKRGDIIVFHPPIPNETRFFVKRVIGLPGDVVEVRDRKVFINGIPISEPYVKEEPLYTFGPVTVPPGEYFVLGDNRNNSYDSHAWDYPFVSRKMVEGRVVMIVFPLRRIRIIRRPTYRNLMVGLREGVGLYLGNLNNIFHTLWRLPLYGGEVYAIYTRGV